MKRLLNFFKTLVGIRRNGAETRLKPFQAVASTANLSEFVGTLPRLRPHYAEHHLFATEIDKRRRQALLDQGFRIIGGDRPTHIIYCYVRFKSGDRAAIRLLFNFCLDFSHLSRTWQRWLAIKLTEDLARSLSKCEELWPLVRCRTMDEFAWCVEDSIIDHYWETELSAYFRYYSKRLPK